LTLEHCRELEYGNKWANYQSSQIEINILGDWQTGVETTHTVKGTPPNHDPRGPEVGSN
jgi:hypothetical protein